MPGAKRRPDHAQADPGALAAREQHGNQMGLSLALQIEAAIFTVPKHRNGNAMRKLFILTALVFAFFTGATIAIVGTAIHAQTTTAEANW
jgi:hypothetical protein